jgi:hypothetical protein
MCVMCVMKLCVPVLSMRSFYNIYSFINNKKIFALLDSIVTYVT